MCKLGITHEFAHFLPEKRSIEKPHSYFPNIYHSACLSMYWVCLMPCQGDNHHSEVNASHLRQFFTILWYILSCLIRTSPLSAPEEEFRLYRADRCQIGNKQKHGIPGYFPNSKAELWVNHPMITNVALFWCDVYDGKRYFRITSQSISHVASMDLVAHFHHFSLQSGAHVIQSKHPTVNLWHWNSINLSPGMEFNGKNWRH